MAILKIGLHVDTAGRAENFNLFLFYTKFGIYKLPSSVKQIHLMYITFIIFTKRRQQDVVNITLDGENISRKEVVKFLEVFVD